MNLEIIKPADNTRNGTMTASPSSAAAAPSSQANQEEAHTNDETPAEETSPGDEEQEEEPPIKLYKSTRLKGYITLGLASAINYHSAVQSADAVVNAAISANPAQRKYGMCVFGAYCVFGVFSVGFSVCCVFVFSVFV